MYFKINGSPNGIVKTFCWCYVFNSSPQPSLYSILLHKLLGDTHTEKLQEQFNTTKICKNRMLAASDFCLHNQSKFHNYQRSTNKTLTQRTKPGKGINTRINK